MVNFAYKTKWFFYSTFKNFYIPDILYKRSPSNWTELYRILQLSSNKPLSSSGNRRVIAVSAYMFTILWPALRAVSLTYSFSSAKA